MESKEFCDNMIQLEENAADLYRRFGVNCNDRIKSTVLSMAQEEDKHKEIMLKLFSGTQIINFKFNEEIKSIIKDQFDHLRGKSEDLNFKSEKDFFNFAFEIEKKSIDTFSNIIQIFEKDTSEYNLFNFLIDEEKKHMIYILKRIHELK
jgi:rubrerythrin